MTPLEIICDWKETNPTNEFIEALEQAVTIQEIQLLSENAILHEKLLEKDRGIYRTWQRLQAGAKPQSWRDFLELARKNNHKPHKCKRHLNEMDKPIRSITELPETTAS